MRLSLKVMEWACYVLNVEIIAAAETSAGCVQAVATAEL
jgi:hypothetical protein